MLVVALFTFALGRSDRDCSDARSCGECNSFCDNSSDREDCRDDFNCNGDSGRKPSGMNEGKKCETLLSDKTWATAVEVFQECNEREDECGAVMKEFRMSTCDESVNKNKDYCKVYKACRGRAMVDGTSTKQGVVRMGRAVEDEYETRDARRGCANGRYNSESVCQNTCMMGGGRGAAAEYSGFLTCCTNLCTCSHYGGWAPIVSQVRQCYRNARDVDTVLDRLERLLDNFNFEELSSGN